MGSGTRQRTWQRQQAAKGLCIICGKPQAPGKGVYCLAHWEQRRQRIKARRLEKGIGTGRTNTCGHCGEEGHNRRTCPKLNAPENDTKLESA